MVPFVKKELGLPYIDDLNYLQEGAPGFMKARLDCNVCDELLTISEIEKITSSDSNFYCTKHEEMKFCYSPEWAKAWFIYKQQVNPLAIAEKHDYLRYSPDWNHFSKWFLAFSYEEKRLLKLSGKFIYKQ